MLKKKSRFSIEVYSKFPVTPNVASTIDKRQQTDNAVLHSKIPHPKPVPADLLPMGIKKCEYGVMLPSKNRTF
jgi:hypothetical protein